VSRSGDLLEDVTDDCAIPAIDGEFDRNRREVDAEREYPTGGECAQMPAGSAAYIEDGAIKAFQRLLFGRVGRPQPTLKRKPDDGAVSQPEIGLGSGASACA
jgi:hypothetical protein